MNSLAAMSEISMAQVFRTARAVAVYMLVPGLAATSAFVAVPAVTSRFGAVGWATVAIGLAVGSTGAIFADLGWSIIGPQLVARAGDEGRAVYAQCLATKLTACACLLPVVAGLAVVLARADGLSAALVAAGSLLGVLTPSWYFVGMNKPVLILLSETIPRLIVAVTSAMLLLLGAPLVVYGVGAIASPLLVLIVGSWRGRLPLSPERRTLRAAPRIIWSQRTIILGNVVSTVFTSAPTAVLAAIAATPYVVASYSAVDRPLRMGLSVLGGVPSRLQSWVGVTDPEEARRRSLLSIWVNLIIGGVAFAVFFVLAPKLTAILFTGSIHMSSMNALLGGVLAALICASRGVGLALVSEERPQSISVATYLGAAVGLPALVLLPSVLGAGGALLAVILAEVVMIAAQLTSLVRLRSRPRQRWEIEPVTQQAMAR